MNLIQLKQIEGLQAYIQQNVPAVLDGYQVVFQTGNQFISGDKTFFSTVYASGGAFLSGSLLVTGDSTFGGNAYVSGQLWITGSDGAPLQITGAGGGGGGGGGSAVDQPYITYITGDQYISGGKEFVQPITGHDGFYITGNHTEGICRIVNTQLRIYNAEDGADTALGLIVGKNEGGAWNPAVSVYNYGGTEVPGGAGSAGKYGLGKSNLFYGSSQHFNITQSLGSGDLRFCTVGNAIRDGAEKSFNWWSPESQRMIIHSGGNVGIGVTGLDPNNTDLSIEPLERLHVSGGNFRVDGNIYNSGELWITGSAGQLLQLDGQHQGGGTVNFDYITAIGISGQHLSGHRLDVGALGASISGKTIISGDLTVVGEVSLTGGATVGEEDGDSIFIIGAGQGGEPRVGIGRFTGINQVESLLHVSGNPNSGNFTLQGHQLTSGNQNITGELWITGSDGLPFQVTENGGTTSVDQPYITYITGDQYITGGKQFLKRITGHEGFYITGDHTTLNAKLVNTHLRIYSAEDGGDTALGLIVGKNEGGAWNPALSVYNYDGTEEPGGTGLGKSNLFYGSSQHFTIEQSIGTGDIRFMTVGNAVRDGAIRSFNWYDPASQRMIIHSGGNVGIGVTGLDPNNTDLSRAPLERLHVSGGNFRVDGNSYLAGEAWSTGIDGELRQLQPFGVLPEIYRSDYTVKLGDKNKIIHFEPDARVEVTLPMDDDFKQFEFRARKTRDNANFVGFKSSDATPISGEATGFLAEWAWANVYRGEDNWFIYGNPLVNAQVVTTTPGPTTTTAVPTTTSAPTTTTAAPTPEPSPRMLKEGLMMRFFGWDDASTCCPVQFENAKTVDVNGSQVTRDVMYPSYQSSLLPQLTGVFSDDSTYSSWSDATAEITDEYGTKHTGVYFKEGASMVLPQFQLNSIGGQWDSFNGNMNFLTGAGDPLNVGNGWTICWWSYNKWPDSSFNPRNADQQYKVVNLGSKSPSSLHDVGLYYKMDTTTTRVQMRGNASNTIYATDQQNLQYQDANMQYTTGMWWTFHAFSYGGGELSVDGGDGNQKGNNLMWAVGTGNPDSAPRPGYGGGAATDQSLALYSGNQAGFAQNGYKDSIGIAGSAYAVLGGTDSPFIGVDEENTITFGFHEGLAGSTAPWTGYISDFRLYSGCLTTGELNAIFTGKGAV